MFLPSFDWLIFFIFLSYQEVLEITEFSELTFCWECNDTPSISSNFDSSYTRVEMRFFPNHLHGRIHVFKLTSEHFFTGHNSKFGPASCAFNYLIDAYLYILHWTFVQRSQSLRTHSLREELSIYVKKNESIS